MKITKYLGLMVITSCLSITAFAMGGAHKGHLVKALDLSDAQQEQLKVIHETNKQNRKQGREAFLALQAKKQALLDDYDETQAQAIADEEAQMHKEKVLKHLDRQQAIYAILTDEQKEKFKSMLSKGQRDHHRQHDVKKHKKIQACDQEA